MRTQQNASSYNTQFRRNPGIIEIGFQNHPPDRRRFENLNFSNWISFKKFKHRRARACPPKILTSCHTLSHNFEIVHTDTPFRQATMGFSSSLATKPYKNNLVLISIVFIISPHCFWSVLSLFWTLPGGRHHADPSTDEDVPCVELPIPHTVCISGTFAP